MSSEAKPSAEAVVSTITDSLLKTTEAFSRNEPGSREKLLSLSYLLSSTLEQPGEKIQRNFWTEPARNAAIRVAVDLDLFVKLAEGSGKSVHVKELANSSGADARLLSRLMKHLAATNVVLEVAEDSFAPTEISNAFTVPKYRDGVIYTYDVAGPSFRALPEYLKSTSYHNPGDITNGPFQFAHDTKNPFFAWIGERPVYQSAFNNYMSCFRQKNASWMDPVFYPVKENLAAGLNADAKDAVLLVDVGGGIGHDLEEFKQKHPDIPGRLVLQELAQVIEQIKSPSPGIEPTVHDFFTPQPIKGARAYYLHSVLHDWDDASCIKILQHITSAMTIGYSKVLINELVVPDEKAAWPMTSMDALMMVLGAVKERTERDWRDILTKSGLAVSKVWRYEDGGESLIEAVLEN